MCIYIKNNRERGVGEWAVFGLSKTKVIVLIVFVMFDLCSKL